MTSDSNTDRQLAGLCRRAEMDERKRGLPLPVQDMVRHMTRSLGSSTGSDCKLPDFLPLTFRHDQCDSKKVEVALTSNIHTSAKTFSSPSCPSVSSSTVNKLSRPANMDTIVQSGSFSVFNVASPPPAFHDQTRSAVVRFPTNSKFSSKSVNSNSEPCGLDRIERSSMKFYTDNTAHQTTADCIPAEFSVAAKLQHDSVAKHFSSNPILSELHMEQTISLDDVMMSSDSDSQCPYSKDDISYHDVSECSSGAAIRCRLSGAAHVAPSSLNTIKHMQPMAASTNGCHKPKAVTANILENMNLFRINFPQRACRPQIGIAAVIKSNICPRQDSDGDNREKNKKDNDTQEMIKFQSPEIHKLISVTLPQPEWESDHFTCSKVDHERRNVSVQIRVSSNQTVPSSSSISKWGSVSALQTATVCSDMEESTDEKWKEVKNFLGSPDYEPSVKRRKLTESGSSEQISDDDDNADDDADDDDISSSAGDKDDDSDDDYSDIDADLADIKPSECESLVALGKKQKQYFWQYNVQSKGPKGTRLKLAVESPSDPHVLNDFEDPVFDQCNTAIAGIRHGGKARKGDGNEITPNPKKLFMLGHQLMRLSHQINGCQLGTDVPLAKRNEARKEKNKLASRACRLKKKAQHEANKIKLYGLQQEHSQLNSVLQLIWPQIHEAAKSLIANTGKLSTTSEPLTRFLEAQISHNLKSMIAGHTVEYVNSVILKVESGDYSGGLNTKRSHRA